MKQNLGGCHSETNLSLLYLIPSQTRTDETVSTVLSIPSAIRPAEPEMNPKVNFKTLSKICTAMVTMETTFAENRVPTKKGMVSCMCSAISRPPGVKKNLPSLSSRTPRSIAEAMFLSGFIFRTLVCEAFSFASRSGAVIPGTLAVTLAFLRVRR